MKILQSELQIQAKPRGCHLITREIEGNVHGLSEIERGVAHVFLQHTSASLTLNENASPDVRSDLDALLDHLVPEGEPYYQHTIEGRDDMPAHGKSSLLGTSLTIPVSDGRFNLGTWQGIYLCEHRNRARSRRIVVTVLGE